MPRSSKGIGSKPSNEDIQDWWQWLLSIPDDRSPLHGGDNADQGQAVTKNWCLASTGGRAGVGGVDPNVRMLDARGSPKDILIGVFVAAYNRDEAARYKTPPLDAARKYVSKPKIVLKVDSQPLVPHYMETGPFEAKVPDNHILDTTRDQAGTYEFYSAGFWLKIPNPRTSKKYRITFGGSSNGLIPGFRTEATYEVQV